MKCAILAIELSQRRGSVAIEVEDEAPDIEWLAEDRRSDVDLLPAIERLCRRRQVAPHEITTVAVSTGPGGFTGLRVSITCARVLGAQGATLVAVPSALVAAEAWSSAAARSAASPGPEKTSALVIAAVKERRSRTTFWASRCDRRHDDAGVAWIERGAGLNESIEALLDDEPDIVLADEHLPAALRAACAARGVLIAAPAHSALACLAAGRALLARGIGVGAAALEPVYAREPEAVTLWNERRATDKPAPRRQASAPQVE